MQTVTATDTATASITGTSSAISVTGGQFTAVGSMSVAREFHTATLLNDGTVLVAGGDDGSAALVTAELFDPATGNFTASGSLATARQNATATQLASGKVLIVGGYGANGQALASAELFDPSTKTFAPAGAMTTARGQHTATLLKNGNVMVAGGAPTLTSGTGIVSAEIYDASGGTFSVTGSMGTARFAHAAVLLNSGIVLVAGGGDFVGGTASAEFFDPATGTFTAGNPMTSARAWFTATLLANGKVLLAGGDHIESTVTTIMLSTGELFDPATGTFTSLGQMTAAREGHTATLRGDGTVLIAGGDHVIFTGGSTRVGAFPHTTSTTESFDPAIAGFTAEQSLLTDRTAHTATLLTSGKLLIAGGTQYRSPAPQIPPTKVTLPSAELLQ
jgi:hypothetical protein